MSVERVSFKDAVLNKDKFSVSWELVPGRGSHEKDQDAVALCAKEAVKDLRINAITLTDNPSGTPAIHPGGLSKEVEDLGIDALIHFTCKDKNRNQMESELYALDRVGLKNLLVMTGDYVTAGYNGRPKPVFDVDSVQTVKMIEKLNAGLEVPMRGKLKKFPETDFFAGAVVSPFKSLEAETMAQYAKLHQKVAAGAKYIITQVGWDARKFDELRKYVDKFELNVPIIGNIYILTLGVAKMMNRGAIPGAVVTDEFLKDLEAEKKEFENNKERQLLRAAKLFAVLKGIGYDGVTIAGHGISYQDIKFVLDKGEEFQSSWQELIKEFNYPEKNGFYFFEKDQKTGLNTKTPVDRSKTGEKSTSLFYWSFNMVHRLALSEQAPLYPMIKWFAKKIDKSFLKKPFTYAEYYTKTITNECKFCGDCVMHELAFQCPMSQCAKHQRNGACGGGKDGWCEVYPGEKRCIYVNMYEKLKHDGKEYIMNNRYAPPADWNLYQTSSWLNFFNERDYNHRKDD